MFRFLSHRYIFLIQTDNLKMKEIEGVCLTQEGSLKGSSCCFTQLPKHLRQRPQPEGRPGRRASRGGGLGRGRAVEATPARRGVGGIGRRQNNGGGLGFVNRTGEPGRGEMHGDTRIDRWSGAILSQHMQD
jgi:hypothetical protein